MKQLFIMVSVCTYILIRADNVFSEVHIDAPNFNDRVTGRMLVHGWSTDKTGSVDIRFNGTPAEKILTSFTRTDVPNVDARGWAFAFGTDNLANGWHTMVVDSGVSSDRVKFYINNSASSVLFTHIDDVYSIGNDLYARRWQLDGSKLITSKVEWSHIFQKFQSVNSAYEFYSDFDAVEDAINRRRAKVTMCLDDGIAVKKMPPGIGEEIKVDWRLNNAAMIIAVDRLMNGGLAAEHEGPVSDGTSVAQIAEYNAFPMRILGSISLSGHSDFESSVKYLMATNTGCARVLDSRVTSIGVAAVSEFDSQAQPGNTSWVFVFGGRD